MSSTREQASRLPGGADVVERSVDFVSSTRLAHEDRGLHPKPHKHLGQLYRHRKPSGGDELPSVVEHLAKHFS